MKRIEGAKQIQVEVLEGKIINSYPERLGTVQITKGHLNQLQANQTARNLLMGAGAIACIGLGLCFIRLALFPRQQPAVLPQCESNCNYKRGTF
jgi:hypothetical protein